MRVAVPLRRVGALIVAPCLLTLGLSATGLAATSMGAAGPAQAASPAVVAAPHGASARYVAPPPQLQLPTGLRQICRTPTRPGRMQCDAMARTAVAGAPAATAPPAGALQPAQLTGAYGLASAARSLGGGETVAIVDAYDDAHAASDLAVYRSHYGLPACTTGSGCLTIVNQAGAAGPLPHRAVAWAEEETLDLDMISAICPNCRILLVEARSPGAGNLSQAEATAAARARYVTNGWGSGSEFVGENQFDHAFDQPGVAITAAAGNFGYGTQWPAASQYVTSVGGTTLTTAPGSGGGFSRAAETAWSLASDAGAGSSGCSVLEAKPSWQQDSGCPNRTENDVAADANPDTGAAVYDSVPEHGLPQGWQQLGGTSAAAAIIAATYALANSSDRAAPGAPQPGTYPSSYFYAGPAALFDVTAGSTGSCGPGRGYLCTAGPGYDGPTGFGSPDGLAGFSAPVPGDIVTITDPGTQDYLAGSSPRLQLQAVDSAGWRPVRYTAAGLPAGLSLSSSGRLSGTTGAAGTATVTVTASDATGASDSVTFTINVIASGAPVVRAATGPLLLAADGECLAALNADLGGTDAARTGVGGTGAALARCAGGMAQHWAYTPDWNPGGTGLLTTGGECLQVSAARHPGVTLAPCTNNASQQWQPLTLGELYNPASGECLTDPPAAGAPPATAGPAPSALSASAARPAVAPTASSADETPVANGTPVQAAPCDSTPGQSWQLPPSEVVSGAAGLCLTDPGNSTSNGTPMELARCAGVATQDWSLQADGTIQLHGRCLDVRGGSVRPGGAVQLYSCFGGLNEIWITGPDGELINANSGLCLAAPGGDPDSGDALVQQDCAGAVGEIWTIS